MPKPCARCKLAPRVEGQRWCQPCQTAYAREWRDKNRDKVRANNKRSYQRKRSDRLIYAQQQRVDQADSIKLKLNALRNEKRAIVVTAKDRPCADCGIKWPPVAMDFDHVRGDKKYNISHMAGGAHSIEQLREEIAKCDVVCACCHRLRTEKRRLNAIH